MCSNHMYLRKANDTTGWYVHLCTVEIFPGIEKSKSHAPLVYYVHFSSVEIFPGVSQGDVSEFPGKSNNWAFAPYLKFKF